MANLKQGMSGSEVKDLQQKLINAGYDVGSTKDDGVFGKNTLAAVKQFQSDNGLAVDGIAGVKTLGALNSIGSNNGNTTGNGNAGSQNANAGTSGDTFTTPAGNTYESFTYDDFTYDPYQQSDIVNQAWDTVGQLQANAPGAWSDPYRDKYLGYLNQYENRDPFSYDFNSDALYQQYKDQYIQQGQMAMMDTMGQAAAMTGGYGNSYAQTVGQQVYNQHLNQLNAIIPELYDRAYGIYQQEGKDLLNMYNAYLGLSEQDYSHYLGEVDNYYKQLGAAQDYANTLYNKEYGEWADKTKMDFDTWSANTGLSFDEWAAKTGIISDENNTLMNQKFQAEEAEKDREFTEKQNDKSIAASNKASAKSDLINLIASTGYYPTDQELKAAGMTREQANAYASSRTPTYTELEYGGETYRYIEKEIAGAKNIEGLNLLVEKYLKWGYDPEMVDKLTKAKAIELLGVE